MRRPEGAPWKQRRNHVTLQGSSWGRGVVSFLLPRPGVWGGGRCCPRTGRSSPRPPFLPFSPPPRPPDGMQLALAAFVTRKQPPNIRPGGLSVPLGTIRHPPGLPRATAILQLPEPRLSQDPCSSSSLCPGGAQAPVLGCACPAAPPCTPTLPPWSRLDSVTKGFIKLPTCQFPRVYGADIRERGPNAGPSSPGPCLTSQRRR